VPKSPKGFNPKSPKRDLAVYGNAELSDPFKKILIRGFTLGIEN